MRLTSRNEYCRCLLDWMLIKGYRQGSVEKIDFSYFYNILKDIRIENTYAKFQREIDGDAVVFVE